MAFDIDRYTRQSEPVSWEDLDYSVFRENPLPPATLRTLRYMCEIEFHTVCYLRDMLVSPSRKDPQVGSFMSTWNWEEIWHGEALSHVLELHGITVKFDELKAKRVKLGWRDRISPVKQSMLSNIVGIDFVAVHMLWGSINERSTAAAYKRLASFDDSPVLTALLKRIAAQETKHIAFYTTQAQARLEDNPRAQKLARMALRTAWQPVGSGVSPESEVNHVMHHLFSGPEGRREIAAVDRYIATLPGMAGLTLLTSSLDERGVPA
ncbi:acyl-ACP desaturase [Kocuria tytonis]|uniref:Ferritin-like domain-containing protein n=1 Tax=Kocuria tytonis TaxID=2054280 RepID=A0A495A9J6_9MICC|nr:acyl-ACP desaturase [Kocuria tytonis]RKQ35207.1 ferritin-like domain-containing protein [Kocuria tytonis]